ncbi:tRNA (guanosine(46)-N7)-methyltransferase TrmB [candidate division KSB1 bacterium]|nr:tRNA (guanosine(46)-N7)-methyltransferase TrmB [candidate division KSB1 bacterium]
MSKNKLVRFRELPTFKNVVLEPEQFKGKWSHEYFKNDNPVTLELGCGKGEYTLELAQRVPDRNYIGIDLKGARLWVAAKKGLYLELGNAVFIRMHIEKINDIFDTDEVDEIWLPFPDPYPKKPNKRLISPRYLSYYREFLKSNGKIHFKTDDTRYYFASLRVLESEKCTIHNKTDDLYQGENTNELTKIKTTFELKHLALDKKIKYICFSV